MAVGDEGEENVENLDIASTDGFVSYSQSASARLQHSCHDHRLSTSPKNGSRAIQHASQLSDCSRASLHLRRSFASRQFSVGCSSLFPPRANEVFKTRRTC